MRFSCFVIVGIILTSWGKDDIAAIGYSMEVYGYTTYVVVIRERPEPSEHGMDTIAVISLFIGINHRRLPVFCEQISVT